MLDITHYFQIFSYTNILAYAFFMHFFFFGEVQVAGLVTETAHLGFELKWLP